MSETTIRALRVEAGLSQVALADRAGVPLSLVERLEGGDLHPEEYPEEMKRLHAALGHKDPGQDLKPRLRGGVLRAARKALRMTPGELAEALEVGWDRIRGWETERERIPEKIHERVLILVKEKAGVDLQELISRQEPEERRSRVLIRFRRRHGLTQAELAKRLGVAQAMISQWENEVARVPETRILEILRLDQDLKRAEEAPRVPVEEGAAVPSTLGGSEP